MVACSNLARRDEADELVRKIRYELNYETALVSQLTAKRRIYSLAEKTAV